MKIQRTSKTHLKYKEMTAVKKLLFAIVACVVLCSVTAVAEVFEAEYYEIPYELI